MWKVAGNQIKRHGWDGDHYSTHIRNDVYHYHFNYSKWIIMKWFAHTSVFHMYEMSMHGKYVISLRYIAQNASFILQWPQTLACDFMTSLMIVLNSIVTCILLILAQNTLASSRFLHFSVSSSNIFVIMIMLLNCIINILPLLNGHSIVWPFNYVFLLIMQWIF